MKANPRSHAWLAASLTVALLTTGCASSIDPAAKADLDARIANLQVNSATMASGPAGVIARIPLAAGQWVQYRMRLTNGQPKLLTEKLIKQQGGQFWYEVVHDTYQGRTIEQLLVAVGHNGGVPHAELLAVRTKDARGRVNLLSARVLSLPIVTYGDYRAMAAALVAPWPPRPQEPQESALVPAGRFEGCYHKHSEMRFGRPPYVTDSWWHPSVPLFGLVRLQDNHGLVNELVGYGTSGARSDF